MSTPERAGWYDDPQDESQLRYFDGIVWSDHTTPRRGRPTPPVEPEAPTQAPGGAYGHTAPGTDVFGRPTGAPTMGRPQVHPAHTTTAGPTTADGQVIATYGSRVGAYLIDSVILFVLYALFAGWAWWLWMQDYMAFVWDAANANDPSRVEQLTPEQLLGMLDWKFFFIGLGITLLVQAIYHVGFLTARNATPGKMLLGLTVRRVERAGRIGAGTAFMRSLLPLGVGVLSAIPLVSYLMSFVSLADLLWPLRDPSRQALHDKIAGTVVVKGRQPSSGPAQES